MGIKGERERKSKQGFILTSQLPGLQRLASLESASQGSELMSQQVLQLQS